MEKVDIGILKEEVEKVAHKAVEVRRELHRLPELGNEEFRTVEIIGSQLDKIGLDYKNILPTGIIATITQSSKTLKNKKAPIALRADIDGLPINEKLKLPFSSILDGYMHACGHDVHTAILLGTAMVLTKYKDLLRRDIRLIFQPAEETTGGADRMVAAGCLKNPDIKEIYGLHIMPELPAGRVGIKKGCVHAASDMFEIHVKGKGSHGASPELGIDALLAASQIVNNLQSLVSRSVPPSDPAVLTIGSFRSGKAKNVIADEAFLEGIIRTLDPSIGELIKRRMEEVVEYTSLAAGAEGKIKFEKGYRALVNHTLPTARVERMAEKLLGKENCATLKTASMRVEDFSHYLNSAEGCFFFLGSGFPHRENPTIHSPNLYVNEKCIEVGILLMSSLCLL